MAGNIRICNFAIMNLSHLTNHNNAEPGRIAYNAAMYLAVEEHDGKEMLVCRPRQQFLDNEDFMEIFARLGQTTELYTNPCCLRLITYENDNKGPFWYVTPGKYISLAQLMTEKDDLRVNEKWVDKTIAGLIEAVQYVNKHDNQILELTPHSILVTKDTKNLVTLMPPLSDFVSIKNIVWPKENEKLAPELFNIEEPDQRADIYGIGRIIQYLHPYPSLPYKYASLVSKSVSEKVSNRPKDAEALLSSINKRAKGSSIAQIIITASIVLGLLSLLVFYPWEEEPKHDFQDLIGADSTLFDDGALSKNSSLDPLVNTDIQSASEAEKARMLDDYLHDSIYMSMDTAYSLSPEMKEYQREMMKMSAEKYRTAFKLQARPILKKVYTKANMENQDLFLKKSQEANNQLLSIQEALTKQYQLDPTTSNRITAEVYDEVIDDIKKAWK